MLFDFISFAKILFYILLFQNDDLTYLHEILYIYQKIKNIYCLKIKIQISKKSFSRQSMFIKEQKLRRSRRVESSDAIKELAPNFCGRSCLRLYRCSDRLANEVFCLSPRLSALRLSGVFISNSLQMVSLNRSHEEALREKAWNVYRKWNKNSSSKDFYTSNKIVNVLLIFGLLLNYY